MTGVHAGKGCTIGATMLEKAGFEAFLAGGAVRDYVRDNSLTLVRYHDMPITAGRKLVIAASASYDIITAERLLYWISLIYHNGASRL